MAIELTSKQARILEFIRSFIVEHRFPPTLRDIGRQFGIRSTNGVNDHLRALERKGYIARSDMMARSIRLTDKPVLLRADRAEMRAVAAEVERRSVVYFAQSLRTLLVKIGCTSQLAARAGSIAGVGGVVILVTVAGSFPTEKALHEKFQALRVEGEWFRPEPELVECVAKLRALSSEGEQRLYLGLPEQPETAKASKTYACSICGEVGHTAPICEHSVSADSEAAQ